MHSLVHKLEAEIHIYVNTNTHTHTKNTHVFLRRHEAWMGRKVGEKDRASLPGSLWGLKLLVYGALSY